MNGLTKEEVKEAIIEGMQAKAPVRGNFMRVNVLVPFGRFPLVLWLEGFYGEFTLGVFWFRGQPKGFKMPYWSVGFSIGMLQIRASRSIAP